MPPGPQGLSAVQKLLKTFLSGLIAVLPIMITIAVVFWLVGTIESMLGEILRLILPTGAYWRGMGLFVGLLLVLAVGFLMRAFFFREFVKWFEHWFERIPLIKTVYGAVRDLTGLFSKTGEQQFDKVVMVQWPGLPMKLLGFVTIEDFSALQFPHSEEDEVAVYMPMSYQIGGYTAFIPRRCLTRVDMSFEDAMRFVVTAGMSRSPDSRSKAAPPDERV